MVSGEWWRVKPSGAEWYAGQRQKEKGKRQKREGTSECQGRGGQIWPRGHGARGAGEWWCSVSRTTVTAHCLGFGSAGGIPIEVVKVCTSDVGEQRGKDRNCRARKGMR